MSAWCDQFNAAKLHFPFQTLTSTIPQMAIHAYPGQGLSLSQLIFALNEELKRVAYCSS